jgi:hypothetical protein
MSISFVLSIFANDISERFGELWIEIHGTFNKSSMVMEVNDVSDGVAVISRVPVIFVTFGSENAPLKLLAIERWPSMMVQSLTRAVISSCDVRMRVSLNLHAIISMAHVAVRFRC